MEAFWIRHLPALKKMQELINGGVIGQVGFARCDFGFVAEGARKARKFDSGLGGGALLDVGIYNLGFLRMVMGDKQPEHVTSEYHLNEFGTDDYSTVLLRYPGGFRAAATAPSAWICQGKQPCSDPGLHLSAGLPEGRTADYPSHEGGGICHGFSF